MIPISRTHAFISDINRVVTERIYPGNVFYKTSSGSLNEITLNSRTSSSNIGDITLFDNLPISVGIRKDNSPEKYIGFRSDNTQDLGDEQVEFTLKSVEFDGIMENIDLSNNDEITHDNFKVIDLGTNVVQIYENIYRQLTKVSRPIQDFKIEYEIDLKNITIQNPYCTENKVIKAPYSITLNNNGIISGAESLVVRNENNHTENNISIEVCQISDDFIYLGSYNKEDEFLYPNLTNYTTGNIHSGGSMYMKDCIMLYISSDVEGFKDTVLNMLKSLYSISQGDNSTIDSSYLVKNGKKVASFFFNDNSMTLAINTKAIPLKIKTLFKKKNFNETSFISTTLDAFISNVTSLLPASMNEISVDSSFFNPIDGKFIFEYLEHSLLLSKPVLLNKDFKELDIATDHCLKKISNNKYLYTKFLSAEGMISDLSEVKYIDAQLSSDSDWGKSYSKTSNTWSDITGASSGIAISGTTHDVYFAYSKYLNNAYIPNYGDYQSFFKINTSSVTSALSTANLYINMRLTSLTISGQDSYCLKSNRTSGSIVSTDYNDFNASNKYADSPLTATSFQGSGTSGSGLNWRSFSLNSSALSDIKDNSNTYMTFLSTKRYNGTTPTANAQQKFIPGTVTGSGLTPYKPYMEITYPSTAAIYNSIFMGMNF